MPGMRGLEAKPVENLKYFCAKPIIEWVLAYLRDRHRDGEAGRINWTQHLPSRLLSLLHAPVLLNSEAEKGRGRGKR